MDDNTRSLVAAVAEEAAKKAVTDTLTSLGVDTRNPFELQKDMASLREMRLLLRDPEFQADLAQMRALRVSKNFIKTTTGKTVLTVLASGLLGIFWFGVKGYFGFDGQ